MSLEAAYDAGNVFARIVRGELPAVKVYEDETALAFMDLFPQSRGHTLVIPKSTTATNLLTEDSDALQALIVRVQRVAKAVVAALKPDGVRIAQFNGAAAGQTIFHLHFHIIPAYEGAARRTPRNSRRSPPRFGRLWLEIAAFILGGRGCAF
jgi:histidine triad (HIT) family protein